MIANSVSTIKVRLARPSGLVPVGRLALKDGYVLFEYDTAFLKSGIHLSPFKLPLREGVFTAGTDTRIFEGLFGVFNDSLPDGWGRLLLDKKMRAHGVAPETLTVLDRLACVGMAGMGALVYEPGYASSERNESRLDMDVLAKQTQDILRGGTSDMVEKLWALNAGSAGARPKVVAGVSKDKSRVIHGSDDLPEGYESWLIKFKSQNDGEEIGAVEYAYSLMAKAAGVNMPETYLFPSKKGPGFFGVKRFDRDGKKKVHMHTASGLLHADHRAPSLDYEDLIKAALILTKSMPEAEAMFRQAAFNVMAHNRDDHAKNFSFLLDENNTWRVAPAYDLVFSSGPGGEHSTSVSGEGRNPDKKGLQALGKKLGLSGTLEMIEQVEDAISHWPHFAQTAGVSEDVYIPIQNEIVKA